LNDWVHGHSAWVSGGRIYDLDAPGIDSTAQGEFEDPIGTILRTRSNFSQFADFDGMKCSGDFQWFERQSIVKTAEPNTWERENSVPGDNAIGLETTILSFDLQ